MNTTSRHAAAQHDSDDVLRAIPKRSLIMTSNTIGYAYGDNSSDAIAFLISMIPPGSSRTYAQVDAAFYRARLASLDMLDATIALSVEDAGFVIVPPIIPEQLIYDAHAGDAYLTRRDGHPPTPELCAEHAIIRVIEKHMVIDMRTLRERAKHPSVYATSVMTSAMKRLIDNGTLAVSADRYVTYGYAAQHIIDRYGSLSGAAKAQPGDIRKTLEHARIVIRRDDLRRKLGISALGEWIQDIVDATESS